MEDNTAMWKAKLIRECHWPDDREPERLAASEVASQVSIWFGILQLGSRPKPIWPGRESGQRKQGWR